MALGLRRDPTMSSNRVMYFKFMSRDFFEALRDYSQLLYRLCK